MMKTRASRNDPPPLEHVRHSLAHVLAAAVLERFPGAKLGIGPPIADGFYYDIQFPRTVTDADLRALETRMREFIAANLRFRQSRWTKVKARRFFASQPFKLDLIKQLSGTTVGISQFGTFTDLCRGGHVASTGDIHPDAFALQSMAGAYWRGNERNPMLTRIYGLAFASTTELAEHRVLLEEAKRRDHKILGQKLGLFLFHETAPGMPYWLPKGVALLTELVRFWREEHAQRGYQEIMSPLINKKELWEISGHWAHFKKDMFIADMGPNEVYGIKPMNCPNAMIIFGAALRSYRDLPLRFSDTDILHRYERSGTLQGLFRARAFRQDDAHIFIREDQVAEEYGNIFDLVERLYGIFGLAYQLRLGTRPAKYLGDRKTWDRAEAALTGILDAKMGKKTYAIAAGDGAFYGPKIDILMKDSLGRDWQMGTIQLDFQLPRRFQLSYIDAEGKKQTPVAVHRVIYGSLERFVGILLEHFYGVFPLWLAPVQVLVLPITEDVRPYAETLTRNFRAMAIRAETDARNETIGKKIREGELQKIPILAIVGKREAEQGTVTFRLHGGKDAGVRAQAEARQWILDAIRQSREPRRHQTSDTAL